MMLSTVFPRLRHPELLRLAATTVLALGATLDSVGRIARSTVIWRAGGHVFIAGLLLAALAAILLFARKPRRGLTPLLIGLLIGSLARWLRGSAGVPPDRALLVGEWICVGLLLWSWKRGWAQQVSRGAHGEAQSSQGQI
jgi:hypothetical protein